MKTKNYFVKWRYLREGRITQCFLYVGDIKTPAGTGIARTYYKDKADKDTGRKISLRYAMKGLDIPKDEREGLWEEYRTMTKKPRW